MIIKVDFNGRFVIPKKIRDRLGIKKDDKLEVKVQGKKIILEKTENSWQKSNMMLQLIRNKERETRENEKRIFKFKQWSVSWINW